MAPLYRGPYGVLRRSEKFFVLQIGDKCHSVSVDRLKPVISSTPVTPAVPPPQGHPRLVPASVTLPPGPVCLQKKKVGFSVLVPAMKLGQNPHQTVRGSLPLPSGYYDDLYQASFPHVPIRILQRH